MSYWGLNWDAVPAELSGVLALLLTAATVLIWHINRRQARLQTQLLHLKRVLEDLISVNERNMACLRAGMERTRPFPEPRTVSPRVESGDITERRKHVWNMAAEGLSTEEITRRMNIPRGQVELILNMRSVSGRAHV